MCQINAHGLYKVNTQVHITAAQIKHGMCVGVASNTISPFQNHINVCVTAKNNSLTEKQNDNDDDNDMKSLTKVKIVKTDVKKVG